MNAVGSRVNFYYEIGSHLFVFIFLHGSTGFHVSDVNKDFIAHGIYRGVFSVCIRILFIKLLGLLSEGFKLSNDLVESVSDSVSSIELGFLGGC